VTSQPEGVDADAVVRGLTDQIGQLSLEKAMLSAALEKVTRERDTLRDQHVEMAVLERRLADLERDEVSNGSEVSRGSMEAPRESV
jgi:hypothetical protein